MARVWGLAEAMKRRPGSFVTVYSAKLTRAERKAYLTALRACVAIRELFCVLGSYRAEIA